MVTLPIDPATSFAPYHHSTLGLLIVPEHIRGGIARYINHGDPVGGFLTAFLSNDLKEAYRRADDDNTRAMYAIVFWFYNYAPSDCWGSPQRVESWRAKGGALGPRKPGAAS